MKLVMTAISALNLTLQTRIMSMQPNTDLTLLRVYQKHKTDNNSIACSSSLRVYKIPLQSLCVFIGSYNLTYVKEKIIASSYRTRSGACIQYYSSYACQTCMF